MAGPRAFVIGDNTQQTALKVEQPVSLVGNTWSQKSNVLDVLKTSSSFTKLDCLPPDPFGDIDGQLLAFKTSDKQTPQAKAVTSGAELIKVADKLGHDPHRWQSKTTGKCNEYVEGVLTACHIPFPWKRGHADCHGMRVTLDKECQKAGSKWEKVYAYDDKHGTESDQRFTGYHPKDGDVVIWDGLWGNEYVQHSGIAAQPYNILYAGSRYGNGWQHGELTDFTMSRQHYGSPTAVYRYKGLQD